MPSGCINKYLQNVAHMSTKRLTRIADANLDAVVYSSVSDVKAARAAITHMGELDRLCDRLFNEGRKEEALRLIADKVLSGKAAIWQQNNMDAEGNLPAVAREVSSASAGVTQDKLEELLSPEGWRAILSGTMAHTHNGVRFTPNTGDDIADTLLAMVFPYDKAIRLLKQHRMASELDAVNSMLAHANPVDMCDSTTDSEEDANRLAMREFNMAMERLSQDATSRVLEHTLAMGRNPR